MRFGGIFMLGLLWILGGVIVGCDEGSDEPGDDDDTVGDDDDTLGDDDDTAPDLSYAINDTDQSLCYDAAAQDSCPSEGVAFFGQDAQYDGVQMAFEDHGDGTVTDVNTGLMWAQDPGDKLTFDEAVDGAASYDLAGYDDWRLPTVKELYSLIAFSGVVGTIEDDSAPYIDTDYFVFEFGDESAGERFIDSQYATSTEYVDTTMGGNHTLFGVNFADGRIKGYGTEAMGPSDTPTFFVQYVRGNPDYGINEFEDNGDGTISDRATGLTWQQGDSGEGLVWEDALAHCEALDTAGHDDWRLPNAKELHSLVDYTRAPDVTDSAAIDPIFDVTDIEAYFWASTTHVDGPADVQGSFAVYVAFGEAMGYMEDPPDSGEYILTDVHGAGAQRSDPKTGDPADYPTGHGPQGDVVQIYNYARCVRGG